MREIRDKAFKGGEENYFLKVDKDFKLLHCMISLNSHNNIAILSSFFTVKSTQCHIARKLQNQCSKWEPQLLLLPHGNSGTGSPSQKVPPSCGQEFIQEEDSNPVYDYVLLGMTGFDNMAFWYVFSTCVCNVKYMHITYFKVQCFLFFSLCLVAISSHMYFSCPHSHPQHGNSL